MDHSTVFLKQAIEVLEEINTNKIENLVAELSAIKNNNGRLFILGVGGSAGHASHATNDFRKLCGMEAYCPTDNVSELTARVNDEGWDTFFIEYLKVSKLGKKDGLLIFSVGGGSIERNVSVGIISAIKHAKNVEAKVFAITGKEDGFAQENAHISISLMPKRLEWVTPISEGLAAVIWHSLVSHPEMQVMPTKW